MSRTTNQTARATVATAAMCALAACAMRDATTRAAFADLPAYELVESLRIDGYAEDLVPINWLGVSPSGVIAIFQPQDAVVTFFAPDGTRLGAFGGSGEAPGEFRRIVRGGWRGDTLWVSDTSLRRVTLIAPDLSLARMQPPLIDAEPAPEDAGRLPALSSAYPYAIHDGDTMLVSGFPLRTDPASARFGIGYYTITADARVLRHVASSPPSRERPSYSFSGGGVAYVHVPFTPRPFDVVAQRGDRIGMLTTALDAGTFSVTMLDARGDTLFARAYVFEPAPVPDAVRDSTIADEVADVRIAGERGRIESELRDLTPRVYPPATALVLGYDGRTWVGLNRNAATRTWVALDADGEPQATIELPSRTTMHAADATHVWVTGPDELGVESVVRYSLGERGA